MKWKPVIAALLTFMLITAYAHPVKMPEKNKPTVLLVTGGKNYQEAEFLVMFDGFELLNYVQAIQPEANKLLETDSINSFDVIVFYDSFQEISEQQKKAFVELTKRGVGLVFLHHSLVCYQDWKEYHDIVGGHYFHDSTLVDGKWYPKSEYTHHQDVEVKIQAPNHPVTKGMSDFTIHDEVYRKYYVSPDVEVILTTNHPLSGKEIGWAHTYNDSRVVYLMLGHDKFAYENTNYQKLIENAVDWVMPK